MPIRLLEYEGTWEELLAHASEFQGHRLRLLVVLDEEENTTPAPGAGSAPTPRELLKLPPHERDRILSEQAALLEEEYRTNPNLTGFDAFGPRDLFDEHPQDGDTE